MATTNTVQINPRVSVEMKEKLDALISTRNVTMSEIVMTALRQYFGDLQTPQDSFADLQGQLTQIQYALMQLIAQRPQEASTPTLPAPTTDSLTPTWTEEGQLEPAPLRKRGWWGKA